MSKQLLIYGAGGFAKEVSWLIKSSLNIDCEIVGFIDDSNPGKSSGWGAFKSKTFEDALLEFPDAEVIVGIASPSIRRSVDRKLAQENIKSPVLFHDSVQVDDTVQLGVGSIVCAGTRMMVDINIGRCVHINLNCTIGHDVVIEDFVTLSPGVHVSGNVVIKEGVFIGTGAVIINGTSAQPIEIGANSVIAAGACVTKSVPSQALYAGVPAILKKNL